MFYERYFQVFGISIQKDYLKDQFVFASQPLERFVRTENCETCQVGTEPFTDEFIENYVRFLSRIKKPIIRAFKWYLQRLKSSSGSAINWSAKFLLHHPNKLTKYRNWRSWRFKSIKKYVYPCFWFPDWKYLVGPTLK